MKRFAFRLFALCLALAWVPATAHCRMEALGLEFAACGETCHDDRAANDASASSCANACEVLESGFYKSGVDPVKVAAPLWVAALFVCWQVPEPDSDAGRRSVSPDRGRTPEWVAQWQFVRRAAAPAHAPDSPIA